MGAHAVQGPNIPFSPQFAGVGAAADVAAAAGLQGNVGRASGTTAAAAAGLQELLTAASMLLVVGCLPAALGTGCTAPAAPAVLCWVLPACCISSPAGCDGPAAA